MKGITVAVLAILLATSLAAFAAPADGAEESYYYSQLDSNGKEIFDSLAPYEGYYEPSVTVLVAFPLPVLFTDKEAAEEYAKQTAEVALYAKYFSEPMFVHLWNLPVTEMEYTVTTTAVQTVEGSVTTTWIAVDTVKFTLTAPEYLQEGMQAKMEQVKTAAKAIEIDDDSDGDKARSIARAVTGKAKYDGGLDEEGKVSNTYDCLVAGETGPRGYALAFELVCQLNGIKSVVVNGTFYEDKTEGHPTLWNSVQIEDKWYDVDCVKVKQKYSGVILAGTTTSLSSGNSSRLHATAYVPERITNGHVDLFPPQIEREAYDLDDDRPFYEKYADYILLAIIALIIVAFMAYAVRTGNV